MVISHSQSISQVNQQKTNRRLNELYFITRSWAGGGIINELRADAIRSIKSDLGPKTDYNKILFGVVMK